MTKAPDAFRTISEVAEILDTPAHVLRFWESRFNQLRPVKRAGGRRYYRPSDLALLAGIRKLLHEDGMTIRGVQKLLRERGVKHVAALAPLPEALQDADDLPEGVGEDTPDTPDTPGMAAPETDTDLAAVQAALRASPAPCPPDDDAPAVARRQAEGAEARAADRRGAQPAAGQESDSDADAPAAGDAAGPGAPAPAPATEAARLRALSPRAARRQGAAFRRLHAQLRDLHARVEAQARTLR